MRMWEIRESDEYPHRHKKSYEEEEAYRCGFEDGYAKAREEMRRYDYETRRER